jgi:hypothetical protein
VSRVRAATVLTAGCPIGYFSSIGPGAILGGMALERAN